MGIGFLEDQVQQLHFKRCCLSQASQQKMAHLLEDQVEPAPPFTHCTVD